MLMLARYFLIRVGRTPARTGNDAERRWVAGRPAGAWNGAIRDSGGLARVRTTPNRACTYGIDGNPCEFMSHGGTAWESVVGIVLWFPCRHEATSNDSDAASRAIVSAVKPASCATVVRKIGNHHSAGIASRVRHLRTAQIPAPISEANAAGCGQSSMIALNDPTGMGSSLGQPVLNCKANLSSDQEKSVGIMCPMTDDAASDYRRAFIARLKAARAIRDFTQEDIAELLGTSQGTYKQYEAARESYIPMHMIPRFCLACQVSIEWLMTGKGQGPAIAPHPKPPRRRRSAKRKQAA